MRVRAKRFGKDNSRRVVGFYDCMRIREGDVFEIHDEKDFSNNWMEKAEDEEAPINMPQPKRRGRPPKTDAKASGDETVI